MKHLLQVLITIFSVTGLISQDFQANDIIFFPGEYNSHEEFHVDESGNKYIAGKGTGDIDFDFSSSSNSLPENSYRDLYLAKYDLDNNLEWLLSFDGTTLSNQIRTITTDQDGNVYITGSIVGTLNLTTDGQNEITNFGSTSMFVAKFDKDGVIQWKFVVGDSNFSQYADATFISEDRLIIQFIYTGTFDVDPGAATNTMSGNSNALLVYNLDGTFNSVNNHTGNTNVRASTIDSEGNIYLGGSFSGLVTFDYNSNASVLSSGIFDAYLVKYDKNFNLLWLKTYSKTFKSIRINKLALNSNDEIIATADFAEGMTIGGFNTENEANFLIHFSKDGDVNNLTEIYPEDSFIFDISINSKDQILLTANFEETIDIDFSEEVFEITPVSNKDIFLAVYDDELGLIGSDQIYGPAITTYSIQVDNNDQIHILTDFGGEAKILFGSEELYNSVLDTENFIYYKLDIEGCSSTTEEISISVCNTAEVNDITYTESGTFEQVLVNAEGCDSILTITCTIYENAFTSLVMTSCGSYEVNGTIINESGDYTFQLITSEGCDSIVNLELLVVDIDKNVSLINNELIANEIAGDTYQWYDCITELPIEGATERTFAPEQDGSYLVIITKDFCELLSDCVEFMLVGTKEVDFTFTISPNPAVDFITVQFNEGSYSDYKISIYDVTGKAVIQSDLLNPNGLIDLSYFTRGLYFLKLEKESGALVRKIVLE